MNHSSLQIWFSVCLQMSSTNWSPYLYFNHRLCLLSLHKWTYNGDQHYGNQPFVLHLAPLHCFPQCNAAPIFQFITGWSSDFHTTSGSTRTLPFPSTKLKPSASKSTKLSASPSNKLCTTSAVIHTQVVIKILILGTGPGNVLTCWEWGRNMLGRVDSSL